MGAETYTDINCCALGGITGLNQYSGEMTQALRDVLTQPSPWTAAAGSQIGGKFRRPSVGHYYFVQGTDGGDYGKRFKEAIEKHKLGTVVASATGLNPIHGDKQTVIYVWTLDPPAMEKWWNENCGESAEEKARREEADEKAEARRLEALKVMAANFAKAKGTL